MKSAFLYLLGLPICTAIYCLVYQTQFEESMGRMIISFAPLVLATAGFATGKIINAFLKYLRS